MRGGRGGGGVSAGDVWKGGGACGLLGPWASGLGGAGKHMGVALPNSNPLTYLLPILRATIVWGGRERKGGGRMH